MNELQKSWVHSLNLLVKVFAFLLLLPIFSFIIEYHFLIFPLLYLIFFIWKSDIQLYHLWKYSKFILIPILIGVILFSLFFEEGSLFTRFFEGLIWGLRFDIVILGAIFFSIIIDPIEIPITLTQIGIPHRYGVTFMVAIRMIPLIKEKMINIIQAQKARGLSWSFTLKRLNKIPYQVFSLMVPLIYSTLEASVSLSDTLITRGYNPYGNITLPPKNWSHYDTWVIVSTLIIIGIIYCLSNMFFILA